MVLTSNQTDWLKSLLPALVIFLLPFGALKFIPLVVMAIYGLVIFITGRPYSQFFENQKYRYLFFIFFLIWLPMLLSLTDAVNPEHSVKTTISVAPYIFVGIYIVHVMGSEVVRNRVNLLVILITTFWCSDAIFQLITGTDFFGHTYINKTRLSGIFYPKYTLGLVLAILLPVVLEQLRKLAKNYFLLIVCILVASIHITIIILAGSRNSWIMLCLGLVGWSLYVMHITGKFQWKKIAVAIIIGLPVIYALSILQPTRIDTLIEMPSKDIKTIDRISNHRLPLWEAAAKMSMDHWVNGIGPRGFRHLYDEYQPEKGKYDYDYSHSSTHPHFALLEIATETGVIGLLCILIMLYSLFARLKYIEEFDKLSVYPWYLGVSLAIVPNIAKAFYSSFWMSIVLCMLFIGIANGTYKGKS